jgi:hypothetical protein
MTKKSQARLQRDADAKRNRELAANMKCWDDLQQQYQHTKASMAVSGGVIESAVQNKDLFAFMPDKAGCIAAITTLSADLIAFNDEIDGIYACHSAKTGAQKDEQDFIHALEVGESYAAFQSRFQSVILPNVHIISEQLGMAINKRASVPVLDEEKLRDTSVVSDVVVKEPTAVVAEPAQEAVAQSE